MHGLVINSRSPAEKATLIVTQGVSLWSGSGPSGHGSARYPSCSRSLGETSTVSGSIRSTPNTPPDPGERLQFWRRRIDKRPQRLVVSHLGVAPVVRRTGRRVLRNGTAVRSRKLYKHSGAILTVPGIVSGGALMILEFVPAQDSRLAPPRGTVSLVDVVVWSIGTSDVTIIGVGGGLLTWESCRRRRIFRNFSVQWIV